MFRTGKVVSLAKVNEKLQSGCPIPRLILDWNDEIERQIRLLEFGGTVGNMTTKEQIDNIVWMKLFKDTLYYEWIEGILDEEKTRKTLIELDFLKG